MKKLITIAIVLFVSSAWAAAPNLTGKWTVHQSVAGNEADSECNLIQTDSTLDGTCKSQDGKDLPIKGSVDGSKIKWQFDSEYNGTPLTIKFTGTVDDSGKMSGSVDVDPFGATGDFTASQVKPAAK
jgi:hypothetical protein